jgi:Glycosyltransferases involved in cell wall biogenesis
MKEMTLDFKTIPSVAVLLSSYNGSKFIERQVQSILNQKDVKVTLFIRDDGSKDEKTLEILEEYKKIENIVLVQEQNVGLAVSFMNLVYMAKDSFDYYSFADQDDIWLEEKLIEAIKKIKDFDLPALYVSNQTLVDSNENFIGKRHKTILPTDYKQILCNNLISGCTMVWNKSLQQVLIEYKPSQMLLQKRIHDVWVSMVAAVVGTIVYDENSYILYRQHENNVVGVRTQTKFKEYLKKFKDPKLRNGRSLLAKEIYELFQDKIEDSSLKEELYYIGNYQASKKLKKRLMKDISIPIRTGESKFEFKMKVRFNLF